MDTVEAIGANEDGMASDMVVSCRRQGEPVLQPVVDGTNELAKLRVEVNNLRARSDLSKISGPQMCTKW